MWMPCGTCASKKQVFGTSHTEPAPCFLHRSDSWDGKRQQVRFAQACICLASIRTCQHRHGIHTCAMHCCCTYSHACMIMYKESVLLYTDVIKCRHDDSSIHKGDCSAGGTAHGVGG